MSSGIIVLILYLFLTFNERYKKSFSKDCILVTFIMLHMIILIYSFKILDKLIYATNKNLNFTFIQLLKISFLELWHSSFQLSIVGFSFIAIFGIMWNFFNNYLGWKYFIYVFKKRS